MEISTMVQEFNSAAQEQDASKMMSALQAFFTEIHSAGIDDGAKLLGVYSMAEQLSVTGMNTEILKKAVSAKVLALSQKYPSSMKETVFALQYLQNS